MFFVRDDVLQRPFHALLEGVFADGGYGDYPTLDSDIFFAFFHFWTKDLIFRDTR
jgi:hypothetical protein